ncbi:acyl carrier protein [Pedobacter roseus]|uniref:Non-ribosomal peptide synthetase n=1 Tax=Pedobacter roseus TaxID=336820 RepID=A0A7G9QKQ4_9SPHI|nr:acyl carrier protein [Pedobacter roseus]QNN43929.1 non-ribosomal peptide synthetase [Pedobacter roseus]
MCAGQSEIKRNGVGAFSVDLGGKKLIIVIELSRLLIKSLSLNSVIRDINKELLEQFDIAPYDILITPTRSIPRTSSGKIMRHSCSDMYLAGTFKIARSKLGMFREESLFVLNSERLKLSNQESIKSYLVSSLFSGEVSNIQDNLSLLHLGMDSLKSLEFVNRINNDLQINLQVNSLLLNSTIGDVINLIETLLWLKQQNDADKEIIL